MDTAIVVPCYNEAERLDGAKFASFLAAVDRIRFVFVDDGSRDRTGQVLQELAAASAGRIEVLSLPRNEGKAEAVRRGVVLALESEPRFVGYWDADLATPLEIISDFRQLLEDRPSIDLVQGARVQLLGRAIERHPTRHYLGRVAATVIATVLGIPTYDTQCGAKLFRVSSDAAELFREPFLAHWAFDVEILARMIRAREQGRSAVRESVYEFPLPEWRDVAGSKVTPWDYLRSARDLWRVHRAYLAGLPRTRGVSASRTAPAASEGRQQGAE